MNKAAAAFMDELVSSDDYPALCDHCFFREGQASVDRGFHAGQVVFCKTDEVFRFFERLRLGRSIVVLVTGQSDFPCDERRQSFLPPQVSHWFAPNVTSPHPRVTALPLGIGPSGDAGTASRSALHAARRPRASRSKWLYVNFRPETNPAVRQPIFERFRHPGLHPWVSFRDPAPLGSRNSYLEEMGEHRFVLCPPGNGVDTHRVWEALATGAIPVVQRSVAMDHFRDLPILFVDDLLGLELAHLENFRSRFASEDGIPLQSLAAHWAGAFARARAAAIARPKLTVGKFASESFAYALGMARRRLNLTKT